MNSSPQGTLLKCPFCSQEKCWGVCGETPWLFACDDCIAVMVSIRRTELADDTWPPLE